MVIFNEVIEDIRDNNGFHSNKREDSFYRTYIIEQYKPIQVRISNHGTHLWTWIDKDYAPSKSINICIVFSENGHVESNVKVDMDLKYKNENGKSIIVGKRQQYEVIQYVYNCELLDIKDVRLINQNIRNIPQKRGFKDPLANTPKHAKVYKLIPNQTIETVVENKEYNTNKNMRQKKQLVRLTESDLHRVIKESVNMVLNEISASLANKAANSAFKKAREGFGMYEPYNEIPHGSYHGKKYAQGVKFVKYSHDKLNKGQNDVGIAYEGDQLVLKNYKTGEVLTKPCDSIEELEHELGV